MKWKDWLHRKLCPTCRDENIESEAVIGTLERSADALDRLVIEVRRIREHAREGENPLLGDRKIYVKRKERPR